MKKENCFHPFISLSSPSPTLSSADELMDITRAAGYTEATEAYRPKSTLLIDGTTGDVLWEENADEISWPSLYV